MTLVVHCQVASPDNGPTSSGIFATAVGPRRATRPDPVVLLRLTIGATASLCGSGRCCTSVAKTIWQGAGDAAILGKDRDDSGWGLLPAVAAPRR